MDAGDVANGLLFYLGLLILLTFHEFGHAWTAWKCGDDTAKSRGRVSLNPLVHIDPIGTVVLPLMLIFLSMSGAKLPFLVGWAKPVPVNPYNLRNPRVDDILVTLAGPGMNLLLAAVLMGFAKLALLVGALSVVNLCVGIAWISLLLCFFNLIPIPPLDGSQVVRSLIGMSYETYAQIARYGFLLLILAINIPFVQLLLHTVTMGSLMMMAALFGVSLG